MLKVFIPRVRTNEVTYALEVCLGQLLGLKFSVDICDKTVVEICHTQSSAKLTLNTDFFVKGNNKWLGKDSLPILPLKNWRHINDGIDIDLESDSLPVLYGSPGLLKKGNNWHVNADVLGTIFFMVSRYEELIESDRDKHSRFPAHASIADKCGFLERPIVDEYVEVLWSCIHSLWPQLNRKKRKFKQNITCDVDLPFDPIRLSFIKTFRNSIADILLRKNIKLSLYKWKLYFSNKLGINQPDEYRDTIDWMMTENEKAGNKVAFYFITKSTSPFDSKFNFDDKNMRLLFKNIHERGHEIGIHPGYECFSNEHYFNQTVDKLKSIFAEEGIFQEKVGGRMHYLRWDSEKTPLLWDFNHLEYDSTLSYAEKSGFRCGTSHEFTMFDLINRKSLKVKQRPLINMECTVISKVYEGLGSTQLALERFEKFRSKCNKYNGNYTLLWHNSSLLKDDDRVIYLKLINNL